MQPNDAGDQVQRIDQALNALEQLIAAQASPTTFCSAFMQTASQLLPGGSFYTVHWLGHAWLIDPLWIEAPATQTQDQPINVQAIYAWLNQLQEKASNSLCLKPAGVNCQQSICTSGCTFCLAARNSVHAAWGGLLWQREGELNPSLTSAAFQLLGPLAELWESYWRSNHGQALETIRAGFTRELIDWPRTTHADELAYRLASDLSLATGSERCAIVGLSRGFRPFQLLAVNGLADVKIQSTATIASLKAMADSVENQFHSIDADAPSRYLVLKLSDRLRVILQWSNNDQWLASFSRLSALWPAILPAWQMHRAVGRTHNFAWDYWPQWTAKRWLVLVTLLIMSVTLWITRQWPVSLTIECPGRLEPVEQVWIFAPADGRVEQVLVEDRQLVTQGQALLTVAAPALDLQVQSLASEMETLLQKKLSLDVLASESDNSTEAGNREARRIAGEILDLELRIKGLELQRKMLDVERNKLAVNSLISGRVIGGNLVQELNQKPVRTGDYLFRIVNEQSSWFLQLNLPERDLGHVERALTASANQLPIRFSILGVPGKSFHATVTEIKSAVQLDEHQVSTASLSANVDDVGLPAVPIGAQVLARIDTGPQPWWFVLARPAIESLQRRGWLP